jgi:hypothetical protein
MPVHVVASPGVAWVSGDGFIIDLANPVPGVETFAPYPVDPTQGFGGGGAPTFLECSPSGTVITDICHVWAEGRQSIGGSSEIDVLSVSGLGTSRVTGVVGPNVAGYTGDLWVQVELSYPSGSGLTHTPHEDYGVNSVKVYDPTRRHSEAPLSLPALEKCGIEFVEFLKAPREVEIKWQTNNRTIVIPPSTVSTVFLPERFKSIVSVDGDISGNHAAVTWSADDPEMRIEDLTLPFDLADVITVTYTALRPLPFVENTGFPLGFQIGVYYRTNAQQTGPLVAAAAAVQLKPRYVSDFMHTITSGSGTFTTGGYPFDAPFNMIPLPDSAGSVWSGDHEIVNPLSLASISGFGSDTGYLRVFANIPMLSECLQLSAPQADIEDRVSYSVAQTAVGYVPSVFGQELSAQVTHRVVLPILCEVAVDVPNGPRKGELMLALASRCAIADSANKVTLDSVADEENVTAVYRVPNSILGPKARL